MKIDSGLNGYYYPNRSQEIDRKPEEAPQREAPVVKRSPDALTGSSTLLSSNLANALWTMEAGESGTAASDLPTVPQDWVENRYQEFAEF